MATCQTNNQMRYMRRTMPDTSCPCHETVPMNGCPNTRDFFPANMPIAMAYVPWQQFGPLYDERPPQRRFKTICFCLRTTDCRHSRLFLCRTMELDQ